MKQSDTHVSKNGAQESLALFLDTGGVDFCCNPESLFASDTHVTKNRAQEILSPIFGHRGCRFFLNYMPSPTSSRLTYSTASEKKR